MMCVFFTLLTDGQHFILPGTSKNIIIKHGSLGQHFVILIVDSTTYHINNFKT